MPRLSSAIIASRTAEVHPWLDDPPLCPICHRPVKRPNIAIFWLPVKHFPGGKKTMHDIPLHRECCELAWAVVGDLPIPEMEAGA